MGTHQRRRSPELIKVGKVAHVDYLVTVKAGTRALPSLSFHCQVKKTHLH